MSDDTKIEWADDTVNPWWGCVAVSPACKHCYAESWAKRYGVGWGLRAKRRFRVDGALRDLARLSRRALKEGRERRVFIASMADVFEDRPDVAEARDVFLAGLRDLGPDCGLIPMLLTKRTSIMRQWAEVNGWPDWWWAGTTVEDQQRADERIPVLLGVPARVRFLSCEPMLGPVRIDLRARWDGGCRGGCLDGDLHLAPDGAERCRRCWHPLGGTPSPPIHWVIAGGESGPGARAMHPNWARSLRDGCRLADVPFFFKQWGEWAPVQLPWDADYEATAEPSGIPHWKDGGGVVAMLRVGKHEAGRLLDGVEHNGLPENWR